MDAVSVIVITKNESANIRSCIESATLISNDIIIVDSGSTDSTTDIAHNAGAKIISIMWQGYGNARNTGAEIAKNDWVLAVDADERVTSGLVDAIKRLNEKDNGIIYGFKRQNYFLGKKIRFGEWGRDKVFRLYNKQRVSWDLSPIHEVLVGENCTKKIISGYVNHFPVMKPEQNTDKTNRYAQLNAQKLHEQGKKATIIKRFLSPVYNFIQTYILRLGFLDGKQGFIIATSTSKYVWLKYKMLNQLNHAK